ncbi:TVP38/TMEM64 family protein [Lederbergia citrea]|uniref:TVP38/TMEM64 family protein n=1 Tax=Lederbergia citrea TaxID=2833581 RepID=UPI001BC9EF50|nr:VTT domain-containing protein [Lederbergia citrea]MBS4205051.1 TVP38/TMEM64 family protein [Lederbergia citrea]
MENVSLQWLPQNPVLAVLISLSVNILIAISGILPSAAVTAGNIVFFGFKTGLLISIIGEAAGAIITFIIYRKGLSILISQNQVKNRLLKRLKNTQRLEAVFLVLFLRVLPFVPSGAVTLAAAFSKMGLLSFSIASTLGKIPSLFIEAYSVDRVLKLTIEWQIGIVIVLIALVIGYKLWKKESGN